MQILVLGSAVGGLAFVGPFADNTAAVAYAESNYKGQQWETAPLSPVQASARDDVLEELATLIRGSDLAFPVCQPCNTHYMCGLHRKCRRE